MGIYQPWHQPKAAKADLERMPSRMSTAAPWASSALMVAACATRLSCRSGMGTSTTCARLHHQS